MALLDRFLLITVHHLCACLDLAGVGPQTQGAAFVDRIVLIGQKIDDLVRGVRIELTGIRIRPADDMSGEFDDGDLHAQTDAQIGLLLLPAVSGSGDHAFDAPLTKAARHKDAVTAFQTLIDIVFIQGL